MEEYDFSSTRRAKRPRIQSYPLQCCKLLQELEVPNEPVQGK